MGHQLFNPFGLTVGEAQSPFALSSERGAENAAETSWLGGMEGTVRPLNNGSDSWLTGLIVVMLFVLSLNIGHCRRLFRNFSKNLFGVRTRDNAFDNRTANETRASLLIVMLLCLNEGILLFSYFGSGATIGDTNSIFLMTMLFAGLALAYYIFQVVAYNVVGFTFSDSVGRMQWMRGFGSVQSLLALVLVVPAVVSLFYPKTSEIMLYVSLFAYIVARILFICKGIMIFYDNFLSLIYFILYLCALEVTPLFVIWRVAQELTENF